MSPPHLPSSNRALSLLQASAHCNAGRGSNLTLGGTVECDASVMEGDGTFGAVAAAPGKRLSSAAVHWLPLECRDHVGVPAAAHAELACLVQAYQINPARRRFAASQHRSASTPPSLQPPPPHCCTHQASSTQSKRQPCWRVRAGSRCPTGACGQCEQQQQQLLDERAASMLGRESAAAACAALCKGHLRLLSLQLFPLRPCLRAMPVSPPLPR